MSPVFLRHPLTLALAALTMGLTLWAGLSKKRGLLLPLLAGMCAAAMCLAALAASVPYGELLFLLLLPAITALWCIERGERR